MVSHCAGDARRRAPGPTAGRLTTATFPCSCTRVTVDPIQRCTAHSKRSKARGSNWAARGTTTCRMHGAFAGPPLGNQNALRHGLRSSSMIERRREGAQLLHDCRAPAPVGLSAEFRPCAAPARAASAPHRPRLASPSAASERPTRSPSLSARNRDKPKLISARPSSVGQRNRACPTWWLCAGSMTPRFATSR